MELVLPHLHFRRQGMCREVELALTDGSNAVLVGQKLRMWGSELLAAIVSK